ncbi:MAG: hypothetical protein ED859_17370 [Desulfuromonadales bacterium]|nr:MAG: hypothetical protein ED859_17370 [Desulfuromonadales bacterium]
MDHCTDRSLQVPWSERLISRRGFLALALAAAPSIALANAVAIEPERLAIRRVRIGGRTSLRRYVHLTDLHHCDDLQFTGKIIALVRREHPEFVCFTGDLIDDCRYLTGALEFIRELGCPVYGLPGNHDMPFHDSFKKYEQAFAATGGKWLSSGAVRIDGDLEILALSRLKHMHLSKPESNHRIVLTHYPLQANLLTGPQADVILAGHSHGGQVRIPLLGALRLPPGVGPYVLGSYDTPGGRLLVSAGLGTSLLKLRFNCQPELSVIEL